MKDFDQNWASLDLEDTCTSNGGWHAFCSINRFERWLGRNSSLITKMLPGRKVGFEDKTENEDMRKVLLKSMDDCQSSRALSSFHERISKKRTKNEAKTTKPDTEWKSVEKTQSSPSLSVEKSTQISEEEIKLEVRTSKHVGYDDNDDDDHGDGVVDLENE
ncbi:hypothetical protein Tco_0907246 [Tanacetum coccineum]|uniref:Uncharacterized protein n=1 Tax=Tanacetum coccineum TaxID=301880 RepID=A0ABQ5CM77_9ASTR